MRTDLPTCDAVFRVREKESGYQIEEPHDGGQDTGSDDDTPEWES